MITAAKTTSQILVHMAIGFTVIYVVTGSAAFGGIAAVLEPICNVIVMPLHEKLWGRIADRMKRRKITREQQYQLVPVRV